MRRVTLGNLADTGLVVATAHPFYNLVQHLLPKSWITHSFVIPEKTSARAPPGRTFLFSMAATRSFEPDPHLSGYVRMIHRS